MFYYNYYCQCIPWAHKPRYDEVRLGNSAFAAVWFGLLFPGSLRKCRDGVK